MHRLDRTNRWARPAVAVLAASLVLAACSSGGDDGVDSDGKVTITYATPAEQAGFELAEKPMIDAFMAANPDIKVEIVNIPLADYNTKLTTELRSGAGPDVGRVNHTDIQVWARAGFLKPLGDVITGQDIAVDDLIPGLVSVGDVGGEQMTLPLNTDARVLWYNPTVLKDAGIEVPETWDQLVTAIKSFAGTDVYGYGFPSDNDYSMAYEVIGPYIKAAGGTVVESDGTTAKAVSAEDPQTVAAVELLQEIVATGAVPPGREQHERQHDHPALRPGQGRLHARRTVGPGQPRRGQAGCDLRGRLRHGSDPGARRR